ncbi:hypothetical protein E4T56_gene3257 [Termitomyces sp. T112]|nr:hypothetical protein E4T56_gene3257 [Termitomyces sp. T112]
MHFLSVALFLVSCTSFLTSSALPIDNNGISRFPSELLSTSHNRDLSFELVERAVIKNPPVKPDAKATSKSHANGTGAKPVTPSTCKRKPSKTNNKRLKRETGLVSRAPESSSSQFWQAIGDLAAACEAHNIKYVITGGAAVAALGGSRTTKDVDLLVKDAFASIDVLKMKLPGRFVADEYCTEISMDGIGVDMFDLESWPDRKDRYQKYLAHPFSVRAPRTGAMISVLQPSMLLEDKLKSAEDRKGTAKGPNDLADVEFLREYIRKNH